MIPDLGTFQDACLQRKLQSLPLGSPTCYAKCVSHLLDIQKREFIVSESGAYSRVQKCKNLSDD